MKLIYWNPEEFDPKMKEPNFGDDLNTWMWPKLLPDFFDDDESTVFMGIGSLLGYERNLSEHVKKIIIFGTGAIRSDAPSREPIEDRWHVYFVRGPQTASIYGLPVETGIADPAILLAKFFKRAETPTYEKGYIPHYFAAQRRSDFLRKICQQNGLHYIDPRDSIEEVMDQIGSVQVLVCEAMHGAIAADAVRIPWIPVYSQFKPAKFKWTDFCSSLNLPYRPIPTPDIGKFIERKKLRLPFLDFATTAVFRQSLALAQKYRHPLLSTNEVHTERLKLVEQKIADLKRDFS